MDAIPRSYDECRFDAFCKSVLRNEAHNYRRGLKRQRDRQVSISALSQADMDKLSTVDHYPSDSYIFSSHGYDLHINNELVADAFASLSAQTQSILILRFVLDLGDAEIGSLVGMSRSAVQQRRKKTLDEAVTARYVDVRFERKKEVLEAYHGALKETASPKREATAPKAAKGTTKKKAHEMEL